jgi:hypothetical protein
MEILIHYVKPDIQPTTSFPPIISSLLEGEVIPTTHNSQFNANIKKREIKNK